MKKISIDSGGAQTITTIGIGGVFIGASWGSDDTIMFTSLNGKLMRVPAAGGTPTQTTTETNYDILMLPLGKTVPEPFAKHAIQ